eukprot:g611.t1
MVRAMKIEGPSGPGKTGAAKKAKRAGGAGGAAFADSLRGGDAERVDAAAGGAGGVGPAASIDMLLAIQSVDDATQERPKRQQPAEWGRTLLERLDDIRLALLAGRIPPDRLHALGEALARERESADDPGLAGVLRDIELRARVELAKLQRR